MQPEMMSAALNLIVTGIAAGRKAAQAMDSYLALSRQALDPIRHAAKKQEVKMVIKQITTLFIDIGGVLLTNGWDHEYFARARLRNSVWIMPR